MRRFKSIRVLCTALVMILAISILAGCTQTQTTSTTQAATSGTTAQSTSGGTIKIGLSFGTLEQERWQKEKANMEAYAKELGGIEVIAQSANSDATKQNTQAENLLAQGIDVLLVVPQDGTAAAQIVKTAHAANVPVIAYDRMILNSDVDCYVSFDSVKVGEEMTKYTLEKQAGGNFIVLKGDPTDNNAYLVYEGIMNILQPIIDKGDVKVVSDQWCKGWSSESALANTENALTAAKNDVQGVITSYDGLANGAIQALKAQRLDGKVIVTGQDAELSACQRIVEGTQTMTIYKPISELSKAGIDAAVALAKGEKPATNGEVDNKSIKVPSVLLNVIPVDKANIYEKLIKTGFQKLEEVYKNVPKDQWPQQ